MKKTCGLLFLLITGSLFGQSKLQQDRESIRSLAGCYRVTFEFAETFAPDTAYKYHPRKFDEGLEYVFLMEDSEKKISLQHLLIVNDSIIIKHWRQDWLYENREMLTFRKDNTWKKIQLTAEEARGTWTQKVCQVDDSPRYEGYGTWNHVDGRHFWESTADAPLPRREFTKRNDYNVLRRHSRVELKPQGWVLEQDNEKIIRDPEGKDKVLCQEKGFETFTKGTYNCKPAIDWLAKNSMYWADVRLVWEEIFKAAKELHLEKQIDDSFLYERLFELEENYAGETNYNHEEARNKIKKIIELYILKS